MSYFTIDPGTDHVVLDDASRTGSVVFSVQNKTGARRRVRAMVVTDEPEQRAWYTVRDPVRDTAVDETIQFPVSVAVPAEAASGDYRFRLRALAEDDPDDVHRDSQSIRVQVPEAPPPKPFPWWIVAVVVAVLVVAGVLVWLLTRGGDPPPGPVDPTPVDPGEPFDFGIQAGETVPLAGTSSATDPRLRAATRQDTIRPFFVSAGGLVLVSGELQDRVFRSVATLTMVFSPRITKVTDNGSGAVITGLVLSGYGGAAVEPGFRTDRLGDVLGDVSPTIVTRSDDGDELRFDFSTSPIGAGQSSMFLSLFTEAPESADAGAFRIVVRTAGGDTVTSEPFLLHVPRFD